MAKRKPNLRKKSKCRKGGQPGQPGQPEQSGQILGQSVEVAPILPRPTGPPWWRVIWDNIGIIIVLGLFLALVVILSNWLSNKFNTPAPKPDDDKD